MSIPCKDQQLDHLKSWKYFNTSKSGDTPKCMVLLRYWAGGGMDIAGLVSSSSKISDSVSYHLQLRVHHP